MGYIQNLQVSENFLNMVKTGIGYPVITQELNFMLTDQQIIDLYIEPCYETFCNYFPTIQNLVVPCNIGIIKIDAPTNTLGIVHYAFTDGIGGNGSLHTGNPFYTATQIHNTRTSTFGRYGTPFSYGSDLHIYQSKFYKESVSAMNRVYYAKFLEQENKIEIKTTVTGTMELRIGTYEDDVDKIPKRLQRHFQNYCKGTLMVNFANIVNLANMDLPLEINADEIKDNGQDLIDAEMEYFIENSTIQAMR